ncbi:hypothetical protein ABT033_06360 [Streptomyces pharetrae]|uniref:hypothetical protein n=1 Tax=Streptomyces pharetrae TaxID=291370 RepID=UPI00334A844E
MTNPYTAPPASPSHPAQRPAPRWARKRYALPALALAFFVGLGAGAGETGPSRTPSRWPPNRPLRRR